MTRARRFLPFHPLNSIMGCCGSTPVPDEATYQRPQPTGAPPPTTSVARPAPAKSKNPIAFKNNNKSAVGDAAIAENRRVKFGIVMPESTGAQAVVMFFDKTKPVDKVIAGAAAHAGLQIDKGKLVGSPERLNLFTLEGDVVRLDLEIEAHLGSTLQSGCTLILEKGNRLDPERLQRIKAVHAR